MGWWDELDGPILGRYRIERVLGEGGMARVFLATDVRANRPVAFKTPKLEEFPPAAVKELLSRFNREFSAQASDPIQGVIPIYESGEFTDGEGVVRPFLAMQYLSGGSLGDLLGGTIGQRAHRQTLAEVLEWLVPIARTVDRLHARKYLHRDVKPDNVLFNSDGDPFLADLGIVGSLDNTLGGSTMAATGLGVLASPGSPGYQSPESIQADAAMRNVSASDQFSLAVTVYEALAGCLPVNAGTNQQWYGALVHWSPTPLSTHCPDMPPAASDAVMKAMSTQASGRFTTCSEFAKAMAESMHAGRPAAGLQGAVPPQHPQTPPATNLGSEPSRQAAPTSAKAKAVAAAALAVAATLTVGWSLNWFGPPSAKSAAGAPFGERAQPERPAEPRLEGGARLIQAVPATPPWTVNFDSNSVDHRPEMNGILDSAVTFARGNPNARLVIVGHADPTEGNAQRGTGLSLRRASGVLQYLVAHGVESSRLRSEARGSAVPLARPVRSDGGTDAEAVRNNRRVELQLDAQPAPDVRTPPVQPPQPADTEPSKSTLTAAQLDEADLRCADPREEFDQTESIKNCDKIISARGVSARDKTLALMSRARQVLLTGSYAQAAADFDLAVKLAPDEELRAGAFWERGEARIKDGQEAAGRADLKEGARLMEGHGVGPDASPPSTEPGE